MPSKPREYQDIFHWAETQQDGSIPSFATRKNDPYEVCLHEEDLDDPGTDSASSIKRDSTIGYLRYQLIRLISVTDSDSFASEAVPGTLPQGRNSPRNVRFGLYAEQMTASAFVAPRHLNKKAWLYRARPSVAHQGFVSRLFCFESMTANAFVRLTFQTIETPNRTSSLPTRESIYAPLNSPGFHLIFRRTTRSTLYQVSRRLPGLETQHCGRALQRTSTPPTRI